MRARKIFFILAIFWAIIPVLVNAQDYDESIKETFLESEDSIVPKDIIKFGPNIHLEEPITRDVIVFGGAVEINETVEGNVLAAGGTIVINGEVKGDVRAIGSKILIMSSVMGNVAVAGSEIRFYDGSSVKGSVAVLGENIWFDGEILGDVVVRSQNVFLSGAVDGDFDAKIKSGENFYFGDNAQIRGAFNYQAFSKIPNLESGLVLGDITFYMTDKNQGSNPFSGFFALVSLFGLLVTGLVLVSFAPDGFISMIKDSIKSPAKDFLWGAIGLIAIPIVIIFFAFTIIGIPISLILLSGYFIVLYLANIIVGIILGTYIFGAIKGRKKIEDTSMVLIMVVGVFVFWLISSLAFIGSFVKIIGLLWGFGFIFRRIYSSIKIFSRN